jgi:hypothetical protein
MDYYITTSPGGHYHDACLAKGFVKTRTTVQVPAPAFVGDTYKIVEDMANELNKQKEIE